MTDRRLPDLPSDEELGIAGLDEEELLRELEAQEVPARPPSAPPPPPSPPPSPPPTARGRREDGPGGRRRGWLLGLATLVVLVAGSWGSSANRILPAPLAANAPDTVFSSARAMTHLVELARAPRPTGSPEHTRARELLEEWLRGMGHDPTIHTSLALRRSGQTVDAVTVRNLLVRIPGTGSTGAVLLTAHYDAVPLSHGAGDDGTGVVALLETLRALQSLPPLRNDLILLLTDGEELGLLGARAFVEEHPWMEDVRVVLSAEMRGGGGPVIMFETGAENGWIVRAMQAADPRPLARSFSVEIYRRLPNDTDFTPFREVGIQGLNFAGIDRAWIYHQPTDVPAHIQEESLQHMGVRLLALTRELGSRDLGEVHAPDLVYVTVPVLGIVAYPRGLALPISLGVLLLWGGAVAVARLRGATWGGMAAGAGVVALAGVGAGLGGWGMMRWLPRFHPEFGSLTPAFYGEGIYLLTLVLGIVALTTALVGLARLRWGAAALSVGALTWPVLLVVALGILLPLTALDFQLPALAGLLAAAVLAMGSGPGTTPPLPWARVAALILALPVLVLLVPLVELIWVAMSFRLAPVLGILVVVALAALLPALDLLGEPNRWWAPVTGALLAGILMGTGILRAGPSAERPLPSTLLQVVDREGGEAWWLTRDDPGVEWAEERIGPFGEPRALQAFTLPGEWRTAPAATPDLPRPEVRYEGEVPGPLDRVVRVSVDSPMGAERVVVFLPEGPGDGVVGVGDRRTPEGAPGTAGARRPVTRVSHQGVPRDGRLFLDVEVPREAGALELVVVEEHLRAAELLGAAPFQRPPHLMPNPRNRSDRLLVRTPIQVVLEPSDEEPPAEGEDPVPIPPTGAAEPPPGG
jgi:hypothetical protein